jgi:excisionase family DNA binding protein
MPEVACKQTLTVREVAERIGLSANTIYKMIADRTLPIRPLPVPGRKILFSKAAVERMCEDKE